MSTPVPADPARAAANARAEAQIVARAGHDMRQPLHALALFHAALRRRAADEQTQAIILRAEQAAAALSRVMLDVLALAQMNAAEAAPAVRTIPLAEVFEALKRDLEPEFAAASAALTLAPTEQTASTQPEMLTALLRALLLYAAADGGEVQLSARAKGDASVIELAWTGALGEDVAALLAGDFVGAAAASRTARDGLDLALLVAARLAAALGLAISAAQASGRVTLAIMPPAA